MKDIFSIKPAPSIRCALLAIGLLVACPAWADFDDGVAAYQRGDYQAARDAWQPLAETGDAQAQFNLALLYANGYGVERDGAQAKRWLEAAAEAGNAQAQYNLALMLQVGDDIPADVSAARGWYEKAARQGLASAQNNLGLMYLHGDGMPRDGARAVRWLKRAASRSPQAKANLDRLANSLPQAEVVASNVNLRAGPSTGASVTDEVGDGMRARLLDRRGDWSRLWFVDDDLIGWVSNDLLQFDASDQQASADTQASTESADARDEPAPNTTNDREPADGSRLTVANAAANVRASPSIDASVVARVVHGTSVELLESRDGWRRVRLPEREIEGWIAAFLLTSDGSPPPEAPAASANNDSSTPDYGAGGG